MYSSELNLLGYITLFLPVNGTRGTVTDSGFHRDEAQAKELPLDARDRIPSYDACCTRGIPIRRCILRAVVICALKVHKNT